MAVSICADVPASLAARPLLERTIFQTLDSVRSTDMPNNLGSLTSMYQAQLEVSRRCANAIFSGTEKIDRVMLGAVQHTVEQQLKLAEAMIDLRDPQTFGNTLRSDFLSGESAVVSDYQKQLVGIYTEMQAEIGRTMQEYAEHVGSGVIAGTGRGQSGDGALNPATSVFSMWETAFRQAAELAKENMDTARSAFESAASKAADGMAEATAGTRGTAGGKRK
jgi:hypothetical protein